jgi:hypothetical protein
MNATYPNKSHEGVTLQQNHAKTVFQNKTARRRHVSETTKC